VTTEQDAQRLGSYLLTLGIAARADPVPNGYCLWVHDEDKVARAQEELNAYLGNPADARYSNAIEQAHQIRAKQGQALRQYTRNVRDISASWHRPVPRSCPVTIGLIAVCIGIAVVSKAGAEGTNPLVDGLHITSLQVGGGPFWRPGLPEVRSGEVWRLVTPILLHFGLPHLLFNLWNLYNLGGAFEISRGSARFGLFVIIAAVISNLSQYIHKGPAFGGMSGVLYGLFGYIWMKSRFDPAAGLYLHRDTIILMIVWLFICMTGRVGPIANTAHVSGILVGMAVGAAPILWRRLTK
jgi:GlpG protein